MTPLRWQEIERLYHAALERPKDQHASFLADSCKNDTDLQREVENLSFGLQAANKNAGGRRLESGKLYMRAAETAMRRGLPLSQQALKRTMLVSTRWLGNATPLATWTVRH